MFSRLLAHVHLIGTGVVAVLLVEVQVPVRGFLLGAQLLHPLVVLLGRGDLAQHARHRAQLGRSEENISALTETVGEVTSRRGQAVDFSAILAWLPMHSEQPGISRRAPAVPKVE